MVITTKFNQGDTVWFLVDGKATSGEIKEIRIELKQNKQLIIEYRIWRHDLPKSNYRCIIELYESEVFESQIALRDSIFPELKG